MTESKAPGAINPQYSGRCGLCGKTGGYTLVVHAWPATLSVGLRARSNSTKLYPQPETCHEHQHRLQDLAVLFLRSSLNKLAEHFDKLGRDAPDMNDILFDVVTTHDASKMWADLEAASPADGKAFILNPHTLAPLLK